MNFDLGGKVALVTGGNGGIGLGMAGGAAGAVLPRIALRRWGRRDDFGGIAVYLASDASRYHAGDHFVIDGAYAIF